MAEVRLVARYVVSAGQEDEVLALLRQLGDAVRTEPGNVEFEIFRHAGDPRRVLLLERYASREALDAHRETPHFAELVLGRIVPKLDSRVVELYDMESAG